MTPPAPSDSVDLLAALRQLSKSDGGPASGEGILVALSGGADSVVLLDLLMRLREERRLHLRAAHIDHGLRPESDADAAFCETLCERRGIPFESTRIRVEGRGRGGIEAEGRRERYRYLDELRERHGLDVVATGHHRDDQLETLLLWMFRGAGLTGLRGIDPRAQRRLRPLRGFGRQELRDYAAWRQLEWREDRSNESPRFLRNRIRHELLPQLEAIFGAGAGDRLVDSARRASGELDALDAVGQTLLAELLQPVEPGLWSLPREEFLALPQALQWQLLRKLLRRIQPAQFRQHWNESAYRRVLEFMRTGQAGKRSPLPGGGWLHLSRQEIGFEARDHFPSSGTFTLCAESLPAKTGMLNFAAGRSAILDADRIQFPLRLRPAEPGDRVRPRVGHGSQRLAELLRENGVPRWQRRSTLVVEDAAEIIWVVGNAVAADRQPTETTERLLRLSLKNTERTLCS